MEDAFAFAQKCLEFADTKENGKSILKEIASRRAKGKDGGGTEMDEDGNVSKEDKDDSSSTPGTSAAAARMRASGRPNSDDEEEEGGERKSLEPMSLSFTP